MNLPGYPADDFDRGSQLLTALGSFWTSVFQDRAILQDHLRSDAAEYAQAQLQMYETMASLSRFTIPVFHTENWYLLTILRSVANTVPSTYKSGDLVFGPQSGAVSGRPAGFIQTFGGTDMPPFVEAPLPSPLVDIPFSMQNLVVYPSRTFTNGIDFEIDKVRGIVRFRSDPFSDPLIAKRSIFDSNGAQIDEEIAVWCYKGKFDLNYVYTYFGYVLGLKLQSSEAYKDLLNAIWDSYVIGLTLESLQKLMAAVSGSPIVIDPAETLEIVQQETDSWLVVTSSHVYRFPLAATPVVSLTEGETILHAGDSLSDAVKIVELGGSAPDYSQLPSIALSNRLISGNYMAELTFRNEVDNLQVSTDADGKTNAKFPVYGYPGDVEEFWASAHANGKLPGNKTLAELLDGRATPFGEPGPLALPATINPLQFVLSNFFKNNLFLIEVNLSSFDVNSPGVSLLQSLRQVMPPSMSYVVYIEVTAADEYIDLGASGDEDTPGADDNGASDFDAAATAADTYSNYEDLQASSKVSALVCE